MNTSFTPWCAPRAHFLPVGQVDQIAAPLWSYPCATLQAERTHVHRGHHRHYSRVALQAPPRRVHRSHEGSAVADPFTIYLHYPLDLPAGGARQPSLFQRGSRVCARPQKQNVGAQTPRHFSWKPRPQKTKKNLPEGSEYRGFGVDTGDLDP